MLSIGNSAVGREEANKAAKGSDVVVIEVRGGELCRICHLSREIDGSTKGSEELIWVGCGCKGELGFAHQDCGEAWFRVRGNRYCEICGIYAKNITGQDDSSFMEAWSEGRMLYDSSNGRLPERVSCWRGRPFCNLLLGCLIIAFLLPWFFSRKSILK